jgi:hypothetical protein
MTPGDESYFQQVNRRLAAAQFHLSTLEDTARVLTPLQKQACLEAALMEMYLALLSYINEVLGWYRQVPISFSQFESNIFCQLSRYSNRFSVELDEIRIIAEEENNLIKALMDYPTTLVLLKKNTPHLHSQEENKKSTDASNFDGSDHFMPTMIRLVADDKKPVDLGNKKTVRQLLNQLQLMINRHRENQAEY